VIHLASDGEGRTQPEEIGSAAATRGGAQERVRERRGTRSERGEGGSVGMDPNLTRLTRLVGPGPAGPVGSGPIILVSFFTEH
jgi:hypothetical protein